MSSPSAQIAGPPLVTDMCYINPKFDGADSNKLVKEEESLRPQSVSACDAIWAQSPSSRWEDTRVLLIIPHFLRSLPRHTYENALIMYSAITDDGIRVARQWKGLQVIELQKNSQISLDEEELQATFPGVTVYVTP